MSSVEIAAHRGAWIDSLENTIAAFKQVIFQGAVAVGFDIHLTADSISIVYHCCYLDHRTIINSPVFKYPAKKIRDSAKSLDGNWSSKERVATPIEVMDAIGG